MKILAFGYALFLLTTTLFSEVKYDTVSLGKDRVIRQRVYSDGKLSGLTHYLLDPGFSLELPYEKIKGYYHGPMETYHRNGAVQMRSIYYHGKIVGKADTAWHNNGKLHSIATYDDSGKSHGLLKSYYPDGKVEREALYENGKLCGKEILYWPDGKKQRELNYVNGEERGWSKLWFKNGTIMDSSRYEKGYAVERFEYYESGRLRVHSFTLLENRDFGGQKYTEHAEMLIDSYNPQGQLVGQVRNGQGYIHNYEISGEYLGMETYEIISTSDSPENWFKLNFPIPKEKLIASKDPRYPPKEIPKPNQIPFDVELYGKPLSNHRIVTNPE